MYDAACFFAIPVWFIAPVVLSVALGVASVRLAGSVRSRCLLVAHFVLAIVSCTFLCTIIGTNIAFAVIGANSSVW